MKQRLKQHRLGIEMLEQRLPLHSAITFSGVGFSDQTGGRNGTFNIGFYNSGDQIQLRSSIRNDINATGISVRIPNTVALDGLDGLNDTGLYSVINSGNVFLSYSVYKGWTDSDEAYGSISVYGVVRAPNLKALTPVINVADGSLSYSYSIEGPFNSRVAYRGYVELELYYATGPNRSDIKEKIAGHNLESTPGTWSFRVPREVVQDAFPDSANARRRYIVAIIDKDNLAAESDESDRDNVKAISLPNLVALTPQKTKDGGLRVGYAVEDKPIDNKDTGLWLYWSERPSVSSGMSLIKRVPIDITKTGERWIDNALSERQLSRAPKGKPYLIARIDPTNTFVESKKSDNVAAFNPPTLDFIATSLDVAKNGSLSYTYTIKNADKNTKSTLAEIYWVGQSGKYIGSPIYSGSTQRKNGTYGPIAAGQLGERPNGAEGLALVLDRKGDNPEKSETNNRVDASPEDANDQISEAIRVGVVSNETGRTRTLRSYLSYKDVDMYSFSVLAGQKLSFDYDSTYTLGALRIFDARGRPLTESDGVWIKNGSGQRIPLALSEYGSVATLREIQLGTSLPDVNAYLEVSFSTTGTYYVGVSSRGNVGYDPLTGNGGKKGDSSGSTYELVVTSISEAPVIVSDGSTVRGMVYMPNPDWHKTSIPVSLSSIDNKPIQKGVVTWITIHGRESSPDKLAVVASGLKSATGNQVLQVDWSDGASDNSPHLFGLQGAEWIPYVADWLAGALRTIGIPGSQVNLVGHSWGSYVSQRVGAADRLGTVNSIVALDPARAGTGIPQDGPDSINFSAVSSMSWAFYGNGSFGSAPFAGTAIEAIVIKVDGNPSYFDSLYLHDVPILLFEYVLTKRAAFSGVFNVSRLVNRQTYPAWATDKVSSDWTISGAAGERVFEALVQVESNGHVPGLVKGSFIPRLLSYVAFGTDKKRVDVKP